MTSMALAGTSEDRGHTVETYHWRGAPGYGLSVSSNRAVLEAAGQRYLKGEPIDPDAIVAAALRAERGLANGRAIAADDVVPIVYGGAVAVQTAAHGAVACKPIPCDAAWIGSHVLYGYSPTGERHDVPNLLADLFTHPLARFYVSAISRLAEDASRAIERSDVLHLAGAVRKYVSTFNEWTRGRLINHDVSQMAAGLAARLGDRLLAWKPPGGGASSSIAAIVADRDALSLALELFHGEQWVATPVVLASGLECRGLSAGNGIRITAPHRLDLIGAADLGQDHSIRADGLCCSLAIEPRSELILEFTSPFYRTNG